MQVTKQFLSFKQQAKLLSSRGMDVGELESAAEELRLVNYYRLSGYWYSFHKFGPAQSDPRQSDFFSGTTLRDVMKLYQFDASLRAATFAALAPIELSIRALVGHELGEVDECAHLKPSALSSRAQGPAYADWLQRYQREVDESREDFVEHHRTKYGGVLPVWAAVEVLDWGGLTRLYGFSPRNVQNRVANAYGLSAPQLESWLKSLNVVRNVCAHHGRLFNRVFALMPKLPAVGRYPELDEAGPFTRTFGQLSLIQFMLREQGTRATMLPAVLRSFPAVRAVPLSHLGAPGDWSDLPLWSS